MVEYEYRPELEVFRRKDNRGPSLRFNITEARRIQSMIDLGMNPHAIYSKIDFVNDVSLTSVRTFINNLKNGNIDLDGDYPAPTEVFKDMDIELRIEQLENDLNEFKKKLENHDDRFNELKSDCWISAYADSSKSNNILKRIKKWL